MKEFVTAFEEAEAEDEGTPVEEQFVEFMLDERKMRAYTPHDGQLAVMMATMGRGVSSTQRFATIINLLMETLEDDDADYFQGRLLTRNPKERLPSEKIEEIFSFLMEEWFGRPTQSQSDSTQSPPTDGQN